MGQTETLVWNRVFAFQNGFVCDYLFVRIPTDKMNFKQTFSREFMRGAYEKHCTTTRLHSIQTFVQQVSGQIVQSATIGKTQHIIELRNERQTGWRDSQYIPTNEDLIEGLHLMFPDCTVEYREVWEPSPRNLDQMNKKSGIIIDWS